MASLRILFLLCICQEKTATIQGARILYFLGVSSYSQQILIYPYLEYLAHAGHNVTLFTPHKPRSNVSEGLVKEFTPKIYNNFVSTALRDFNPFEIRKQGQERGVWESFVGAGATACIQLTQDGEVKEWMREVEFDLIVLDSLFSDCALGFAHKFNSPYIIFSTLPIPMWYYDTLGIPSESSWIPDMQFGFPMEMNWIQKVVTTYRVLHWHFYQKWAIHPQVESALRTGLLMPDMPTLEELTRKTLLVFINHHFSVDYSKSFPPLFVPVSGTHVIGVKGKSLPEPMEHFIQNNCGQNGFIYMSFGSAAQIHHLPQFLKTAMLETFKHFAQICFLIKWEKEKPGNISSNVFLGDWMPQQDILADKRIRGFITHGGLLGLQEGVYFGVPLIVIPLFAEQDYNAHKVVREGYGIQLEITTLEQKELENAISEILNNPKYKLHAERISNLFKDRPDKPLETAVWWTEYVLRNKDSSAMLPYGAQQTWFQRRLLDVYGAALLLVLLAILLICRLLRQVYLAILTNSDIGVDMQNLQKKLN